MHDPEMQPGQIPYTRLSTWFTDLDPTTLRRGPLMIQEWFQGRYQVIELLGYGHSSVVLKAMDTRLDRIVALKIWYNFLYNIPAEILLKEGKLLSQINHQNVVKVYDYGYDEELKRPWMALEYLGNETLLDFISAGNGLQGNWNLVLDIGLQVAGLLDYLHNAALLVQLDLKPGNLAFERKGSLVRIMDFGSAYTTTAQYVEKLGTPGYIAPELFVNPEITRSADIFSMGMLLCKLITGVNPVEEFQRKALAATLQIQFLFAEGSSAIPMDVTLDLASLKGKNARELTLQKLAAIATKMKDTNVTSLLEATGTPADLNCLIEEMVAFEPANRPTANEVRFRLAAMQQHRSKGKVPSLFISHASQDKQRFVRSFAECLRGKGFIIWLDEWDLHIGDPFWDRIADAIDETDFMLVVLSHTSVTSSGVAEELRSAQLANLNRVKILPVRIDPVDFTAIPKHLRSRHILDFVGWEEDRKIFYRKMDKLAADIWSLYEAK